MRWNNPVSCRYLYQDCFLVAGIRRDVFFLAIANHIRGNDKAVLDAALDLRLVFSGGQGDMSETGEKHAVSIGE